MKQKEWQRPEPIHWIAWIAFYTIAIAINSRYTTLLAKKFDLTLSSRWDIWLVSIAPAVIIVTFLLILRCIWYQLWAIYQQSNQYVYQEKVLANQEYWSESLYIDDIIFECGQLRSESDLQNYWLLEDSDRKESNFDLTSKKIVAPNNHLYPSRMHAVAAALAMNLKNKLSDQSESYLWIWLGDKITWNIFRSEANTLSIHCPIYPDKYIKNNEINWIVDRGQEKKYEKIILLGMECQEDLELFLSFIFSSKGKRAQIFRPMSLPQFDNQKDYFISSLGDSVSGLHCEQSISECTSFISFVNNIKFEYSFFKNRLPNFYQQLSDTQLWVHILLGLYQLQVKSNAVVLKEENLLIPMAQLS